MSSKLRRLRAPVEKIGIRRAAALERRAHHVAPEHDQLFGLGVRQRADPDGVDQAEDRGVAGDAERERQQRDDW